MEEVEKVKKIEDYFPNESWMYDVETLISCFVVKFKNIKTKEKRMFSISSWTNDLPSLIDFVKSKVTCLVGFNNEDFDDQVLSFIVNDLSISLEPTESVSKIYMRAQQIISGEVRKRYDSQWNSIDLFRIYHFNNAARMISLKWLECHLKMENVQDMPYGHDYILKSKNELEEIISYNDNDVEAVEKLLYYKDTKDKFDIRIEVAAQTKRAMQHIINLPDSSIGELILTDGLVPEEFVPQEDIHIKDLILPYVRFKTDEMNKVLQEFRQLVIKVNEETKFSTSTLLDGMNYDFGLGGIHGARSGLFENIRTADVTSYYPRMAIVNEWSPAGFGKQFVERNSSLFNDRLKYPKGSVKNLSLKLALNSGFGKSNSRFSVLYDPSFTFRTTVNGQLLLAMLAEALTIRKAARVIMINTDGIEYEVFDEEMEKKIIEAWQKLTKLNLDVDQYAKIGIRDCNNYIAKTVKGKIKEKGEYETVKEFQKDPSNLVVSKMVREWFDKGTDPKDYLMMQESIDDFLLYIRAKTGQIEALRYDATRFQMPKTVRYYILKDKRSGYILKQKTEKSARKIHHGVTVALFNKWEEKPIEEYNINYDWYFSEFERLTAEFRNKQETDLFS